MPSLLQTSFLAGLAALAIPVVIHLFFRLRTKRVELGTIRFLRVVLEENARRRKVMRWFLLALRLACVALLVLLFARPYFTAAATGSEKELLVLLIDQSATMQLKGDHGRLIDQAIAEARQMLQRTHESSRVEIATFDHAVHPLKGSGTNSKLAPQQLLADISIEPTLFGATSYGVALAWARDLLINSSAGGKQLHLWTDLQRSGLDWTEVDPLPTDVQVHLHDLGRPVVNNVAVTEVRTPRTWIRPGDTASVQASVVHGGAFTLEEVTVVLEVGKTQNETTFKAKDKAHVQSPVGVDFSKLASRITKRERVKLSPGATVPLDFELPPLPEGLWVGRVTVEYDDDLAFDNRRYFAISSAPPYQVLVVKNEEVDNPLLNETYFLETALRLAEPNESFPSNPYSPEVVAYSSSGSLPNLEAYDVIVIANAPQLSQPDAARLKSFVAMGGGLLVFSGDQITQASCAVLHKADLTPGTIGAIHTTRDLPWRLGEWDEKHLVFQDLSDPQHGDLRQLMFAAYTKVQPATDAVVLAQFRTGDPAILERRIGKGNLLWVTTSCGREWSNWSSSRLFLPIVHQLLGYQVGLTAGGRVRSTIIDAQQKAEKAVMPTTEASTSVVEAVTPAVLLHERFAEVVNASPRESETEVSSRQDFEDRFAFKFVDGEQQTEAKIAAEAEFRPDEVWHWVACLVLGVFLLEGFVGNRTTA